jgi:peptidase E
MSEAVLRKRLLLISSSTIHGHAYLDHVEAEIRDFLGKAQHVVFLPYALYDREAYTTRVRDRLQAMGVTLSSLHDVSNAHRALEQADAIFVGGGNTFRLLKSLYDCDLLPAIRRAVEEGMPYIGSSAGSIVVVGLREGGVLRVENGSVTLKGLAGARIFRRGHSPVETMPVASLDEYLATAKVLLRQSA